MQRIKKLFRFTHRLAFRLTVWGLTCALILLLLGLCADLLFSTFSRDLRPWHTARLKNEFQAQDAGADFTFQDYLAKEDLLFREVSDLKINHYDASLDTIISRFNPAGTPWTKTLDRDWNRSFVITAPHERAVALLVHGLSDSPYSMRSTAEALLAKGITVYGLRVPGHGTIPAGLDQTVWRDWEAAVKVAMREVHKRHRGVPFYAFGYSNGAALVMKHVTEAVLSGETEGLPGVVFLYSPALGITPFARAANLQRLVTRFGFLQKARWGNVDFEIDPFKYQSFARNAGAQLSSMLSELYDSLLRLRESGLYKKLPPVVSFQSAVDATVNTNDLIGKLYAAVDNPESELVFFTLNRSSGLGPFLRFSPQAMIDTFQRLSSHNFRVSLIMNQSTDSLQVIERTYTDYSPVTEDYTDRELQLAWPAAIFSLSHVAIPFPPDDPVYGYNAEGEKHTVRNLGTLEMRGEKDVLVVPAADQLRLKSNPFHSYMLEKVADKIESNLEIK